MSLPYSVLAEAKRRGIILEVLGDDRLYVDAPPGALDFAFKYALADCKQDIIRVLREQQAAQDHHGEPRLF